MVALSRPIEDAADIFVLELQAMVRGLLDAVSDVPSGTSVHWQCDNLRALFVLHRGWSAEWTANTLIADYWRSVRPTASSSVLSFVPSAFNAADPLTRGCSPVHVVRPACGLHPGRPCPEFQAFVRETVRGAGGAPRRIGVSWSISPSVVRFSADMPPDTILGWVSPVI
jgi:hypothetical protein